jgi:hypothetical protein
LSPPIFYFLLSNVDDFLCYVKNARKKLKAMKNLQPSKRILDIINVSFWESPVKMTCKYMSNIYTTFFFLQPLSSINSHISGPIVPVPAHSTAAARHATEQNKNQIVNNIVDLFTHVSNIFSAGKKGKENLSTKI